MRLSMLVFGLFAIVLVILYAPVKALRCYLLAWQNNPFGLKEGSVYKKFNTLDDGIVAGLRDIYTRMYGHTLESLFTKERAKAVGVFIGKAPTSELLPDGKWDGSGSVGVGQFAVLCSEYTKDVGIQPLSAHTITMVLLNPVQNELYTSLGIVYSGRFSEIINNYAYPND